MPFDRSISHEIAIKYKSELKTLVGFITYFFEHNVRPPRLFKAFVKL